MRIPDSGTGVTFVSKRPNNFIPSAGLFNPVLVGPSRNLCLKGAYFLVLLAIPTLLNIRLIINETTFISFGLLLH